MVVLCLSWGFNQVATKLAIHDIPPLIQATLRSSVAALLVAGWCKAARHAAAVARRHAASPGSPPAPLSASNSF